MNFESNEKLLICDTILRDAHQSQAATRMKTEEMVPVFEALDKVGYYALECWGGATFDSCLRFLNEDPWERLRTIRKACPNTKLQMLFRGQNILGYKNYPDDVVDAFCKKSIENGIDIVRVFDALNDVRNLRQAIDSVKKYGGTCEVALCYTISPVHNEDYFVALAKELESMGADIICIKDMAALLLPDAAYSLVKRLKEAVKIPIHLHTHETTGVGAMTNLMAAVAGVDIVDTALSPLGGGTAQPATEPMVAALAGTARDTGLDLKKLRECADLFAPTVERLKADGFWDSKVKNIDTNGLMYQVPGGMLSNMISQLKNMNASDKYQEVLEEVPRVRKDFGYPPLVTPTSQIVGTQAVMNVITGERYKVIPKESLGLLKGEYGKLPADVSDEALAKANIKREERITCRPADLLSPGLEEMKTKYKDIMKSEEDLLSLALFPEVAEAFIEKRDHPEKAAAAPAPAPAKAAPAPATNASKQEEMIMKYAVTVNGERFEVEVENLDGTPIAAAPQRAAAPARPAAPSRPAPQRAAAPAPKPAAAPAPAPAAAPASGGASVVAPMPGNVFDIKVNVGDSVSAGQVVMVLEAMKMEVEVTSTAAGTVQSIAVQKGGTVNTGDVLVTIG